MDQSSLYLSLLGASGSAFARSKSEAISCIRYLVVPTSLTDITRVHFSDILGLPRLLPMLSNETFIGSSSPSDALYLSSSEDSESSYSRPF